MNELEKAQQRISELSREVVQLRVERDLWKGEPVSWLINIAVTGAYKVTVHGGNLTFNDVPAIPQSNT